MNIEIMREKFEKWHTEIYGEKPIWDSRRNLYVEFAHHMAWKGYETANADIEDNLNKIAKEMHYPECWDTIAYPTIFDAIFESVNCNVNHDTRNLTEYQKSMEEAAGMSIDWSLYNAMIVGNKQ